MVLVVGAAALTLLLLESEWSDLEQARGEGNVRQCGTQLPGQLPCTALGPPSPGSALPCNPAKGSFVGLNAGCSASPAHNPRHICASHRWWPPSNTSTRVMTQPTGHRQGGSMGSLLHAASGQSSWDMSLVSRTCCTLHALCPPLSPGDGKALPINDMKHLCHLSEDRRAQKADCTLR